MGCGTLWTRSRAAEGATVGAYLLRRLLGMVGVVLAILTITFVIASLNPGDPAVAIAGPRSSEQTRQQIRHRLGLDRPLFINLRGSWATAHSPVVLVYAQRDTTSPPVLLLRQGEALAVTDRYLAGEVAGPAQVLCWLGLACPENRGQDWLRLSLDAGQSACVSQARLRGLSPAQFRPAPGAPPPEIGGEWVCGELLEGSIEGWAPAEHLDIGINPLDSQFFHYLWGIVSRFDLGISYRDNRPVNRLLLQRLPATAVLAVSGVVVELLIGIPVGIISAIRQRSLLDRVSMLLALFGVSAPSFWLGLILLYLFAFIVPIFPLGGIGGPESLVLPAVTLGLAGGAWYARMLRSSMIEILNADYVRTARAKGLSGRQVLLRHVLRNAIQPIISMVGMDLAYYMGGVVMVEAVFSWQGIGYELWKAIGNQDLPVIVGMITFAAVAIVVMNLIVDLLYAVVDPRVRLG